MHDQIIKMSQITTIQMLEQAIDGNPSSFEYLNKMDIENLKLLRDKLIPEYNTTIERKKQNKKMEESPMSYDTQHQRKVEEIADLLCSSIKLEAERLYRSGGIDIDAYDSSEQYILAKILVNASIYRVRDLVDVPSAYYQEIINLTHI